MIEKLRKHKWNLHWFALSILIILFVFTAAFFENKIWVGNVLQAIGTVAGIYLTIIIFLFSKEDSDQQFREHLEHLQNLNNVQIEALKSSTQSQINTFQEANAKHITALNEATERQIAALQTLTEKQIEALHVTTVDQISSFEKQISEVTNKLTDNSILLAEILGRELEKSLDTYDGAIKREQAKYSDLQDWKLLRTPAEREQQLNKQWDRIQRLKKAFDYLVGKYRQVRHFLSSDSSKQLNG